MKRIGMSVCAVMFFAALTSSCMAQANPWNGSWKADTSSMKYDGPTYTVAPDSEGYTMTRGGKADPKMVCDGQPKARDGGVMTACTKTSDGYALSSTKDGKQVSKVTISMSQDGMTSTRKVEMFPPEGDPYTITSTATKVSGGDGAPMVWKENGFSESQDTGILQIQVTGDSIAFKETDNDKPMTCKLDGTPTSFMGRGSMTAKLEGQRTLKITYKDEGGVVRRSNTFVLSKDGTTVTETDVTPDPMPSTMSLTFHKS